jgi:hypothetical protein
MSKESIGGIWKKTVNTKKGPVEILSISIMGKRYTAWPNNFKTEGDRKPDYTLQEDNYEPKKPEAVKDNSDLPF